MFGLRQQVLMFGTHTIKTTVTDARGQTGTRSDTFTVKEYNNPALTPSYYRVSLVGGNWTRDDDGETLHVNPTATPYVVNNSSSVAVNSVASVAIRYKDKSSNTWSETTTIVNNIANVIYQNLLAMSTSYDLEITATDRFNLSTTKSYTLSSAQRMFDFSQMIGLLLASLPAQLKLSYFPTTGRLTSTPTS